MLDLLTGKWLGEALKCAGRLAATTLTLHALALAPAAAEPQEFTSKKASLLVETLATGLDHPWSVEVLPDGAYIVTERPGALRIIRDGKVSAPIRGIPPVFARGQGGLLDLALSPDFATNRTLLLTYSASGPGGGGTAVARARLSHDEKSLEDVTRIFAMNRFSRTGMHFGSRIAIAGDGSLFFGIGDRGERDRAQNPRDHAGSILHINADGSIPANNPFAGHSGGLPEIWSKGHRNPQGIDIDPKDGRLVTVEHGARGGDEVNYPLPGKNYGWPVITYGKDYSGAEIGEGTAKDGYEQPAYYWDPSIAPGAIAVYRGAMFPEWDGNLLVAALKYQMLVRLERDETGAIVGEERMFDGSFGRLRDVKVAPDGAVLILTDEDNGQLLRIYRSPSSQ
ncbi:glucose/arabinose dehydrogenase [Mycoplana sp. BE70]|uniref:PQQ-dependent sugar dehydrogenase n=1 Tax=Mycoplana sp. BE70 TaxID=2817775 RepID=UPI00285895EF|nr:PQQ-dependent sugar dehydrogenase [Mycoplana sp. BE70]MDR6757750.1 glucose/arabinose dehydrogenase [Mycoplana sp. BE70]